VLGRDHDLFLADTASSPLPTFADELRDEDYRDCGTLAGDISSSADWRTARPALLL
jgi:hypothetical protein